MSSRSTDRRRSPEDVRGADVGEAYAFDPSDPWVERADQFIRSREKVSKRTGREIKDKGAVNIMRGLIAALRSPSPERFTEADWKRALEWRGADVGEAREKWAGELDDFITYVDGCEGLTVHQRAAICNTVSFMLSRLVPAALRPPEPSAEPATGRDQKMGVTKQGVPSAGGEPRYTLTEVMDAFTGAWSDWSKPWHARTLAELFSFRLRSGGATTETGETDG